jgi:hypothetical protein
VTSRSDVRRHRAIYGEEALGVPWRLEPLHAALALTGGLVRVFRPVIQVAMLAMFHTRQDLALRRTIARQSFVNLWSVELSISRKVHDCLGQLSLGCDGGLVSSCQRSNLCRVNQCSVGARDSHRREFSPETRRCTTIQEVCA